MISELAVVDPGAKIADDVTIGPFSIIGPDVELGPGCEIGPHAVVKGPSRFGKNNRIFQFTSIGEDCQDKKYKGENTSLEVGDNNIFREGCTVHRGTPNDNGVTRIGNNNYFMAYSHIAHDCQIGNDVVFANNASVAGHVKIGDHAILGGFVGVHQFVIIGAHSFIAAGSMVSKDVAPYVTIIGRSPAQVHGLNSVGLSRRDFDQETINHLKQAYKIIFRSSATVGDAIEKLDELIIKCPEATAIRDFLKQSERGITR